MQVASPISASDVLFCRLLNAEFKVSFCSIGITQVYASTTPISGESIEAFINEAQRIAERKSTHTAIIGDFYAKVGRRKHDEQFIGRYGLVSPTIEENDLAHSSKRPEIAEKKEDCKKLNVGIPECTNEKKTR